MNSDRSRNTKSKEQPNSTIIKFEENHKILLRRKELFETLSDKKLDYVKNGECDSFIKYGTPSLEIVVDAVQKRTELQSKRLTRLLKCLKKEGEIYDESISYYQRYIKNGGDINYYVNEGIKEWFYKNKTDYLELLKVCKNEDLAQTRAFNNYIRTKGTDKYTERIRQTEMVIRLY